MITLNLIPESEKQEIKLLNIYLAIKSIVFIFIFTLIISTIILLTAKIILNNYLIKIVNENTLNTTHVDISGAKIKKINIEIQQVKRIQEEYRPWSLVLHKINRLIPQGVVLSELETLPSGEFKMVGFAEKREHLLGLKDSLNSSKLFGEFELPYNILFEKEKIKFSLTLSLRAETAFSPPL